jgi:beta-carotene 3-hydroxylase
MSAMLLGLVLFLGTIAAMEGIAYAAHRWVMHGPGWFLHASHHRPRSGTFEANDWYAAIFAIPSILLLYMGVRLGWGTGYTWMGAGIAAYGAIYFGFHDVIVHRRIGHRYVARSSYMKRIVQAHRLHHAVETKEGTVSFGFLWAPKAAVLKAALRTPLPMRESEGPKPQAWEGEGTSRLGATPAACPHPSAATRLPPSP